MDVCIFKTLTDQTVKHVDVVRNLSCAVCFSAFRFNRHNRREWEMTQIHWTTNNLWINSFSQSTAGCNSRPHLQLTTENPMASPSHPLHNQLKIITSEHTRGGHNHNRLHLTSLWFFESLESHKSDILLREGMNGSLCLCQRAVNTEEPMGSTYKGHGQQQLRKTH